MTLKAAVCAALLLVSLAVVPGTGRAERPASTTELMYLSGQDSEHTVDWQFMCTSGRNCGTWTTIPVPSNWELQGFGTYTYGFNLRPDERGLYKRNFVPPARWSDRQVSIVFEGSMTDTEVWVNGELAGPIHQGAFYRFEYDISDLLQYGSENLLEVTVSKDSANASINNAERLADYWIFGGIYRPVYLQAKPVEQVDRLAASGQASGAFSVDVFLGGISKADRVRGQIRRLDGSAVGPAFIADIAPGTTHTRLTTAVAHPRLWTAETPNLYRVDVALLDGRSVIHRVTQRFGFRTVEVRPGDGVYINGKRIMFRGVTRHSFWPSTGRATSPRLSRSDILLMKEMNMNAVLMSHYPPDQHFLDQADELGIYVIDELAGWQKPYDDTVAAGLVKEMVIRDVNHPSIVFWANGNEGGWNTTVDDDFAFHDPQQRKVMHPWATHDGVNTDHYENYQSTQSLLGGPDIFMPTEFLHGLYDGGAGAGLSDYWDLMTASPKSAGGFIWALLDEGVVRTDAGGAIDVAGNAAPDGIVGPYRQKEASFYTVKEVWSPIQLTDRGAFEDGIPADFDGRVGIVNRYDFTNTRECRFKWQLVNFRAPSAARDGHRVVARGAADSPDIAPGTDGALDLALPGSWRDSDALMLTASDPSGREIYTWSWPITTAADHASRIVTTGPGTATATEDAAGITMTAGGTAATIAKATGRLSAVSHDGTPVSLGNGPALAAGSSTITGISHHQEGGAHVVQADYAGDLAYVEWRLYGSGWLQLTYKYHLTGAHDFFGVSFDYPEANVIGVKWLGKGPFRVWKNRMRGVTTDVWSKQYNDTSTGAPGTDQWEYPEFKGYHADTAWAVLETTEADITVVSQEEDLFLCLFTPRWGPDPRQTTTPFPAGDISFLDGIPAMGTKFSSPGESGPDGAPNVATGDYQRTLYFLFGD